MKKINMKKIKTMKVQLGAFKREASVLDFLFTFSSGGI
jgi:hypothetical protein